MEDRLEKYLIEEKKVESEVVRRMLMAKVLKYDDIAAEFARWLDVRNYDEPGLVINGYTARKIYELAPKLDGIGVYNFLVTLRDDPEEAAEIMREGFVVQ